MTAREKPIQKAVVDHLRAILPGAIVHHARNEINKRGAGIARELAEAKRLGALPGFPDIVAILPAEIGVLFFEVKAPKNYPSTVQADMHDTLRGLGHRVAVVRSIDDVTKSLAEWGVATRDVTRHV